MLDSFEKQTGRTKETAQGLGAPTALAENKVQLPAPTLYL